MVLRPGAPDDPHTAIVVAAGTLGDASGRAGLPASATACSSAPGSPRTTMPSARHRSSSPSPMTRTPARSSRNTASASRPDSSVATNAAPAALGATASSSATSTQRRASRNDVETSISRRTSDSQAAPPAATTTSRHETRTIVTWPAATVLTTEPLSSASDTSTRTVRDRPPCTGTEPPLDTTRTSRSTRTDFWLASSPGPGPTQTSTRSPRCRSVGAAPDDDGERKLGDAPAASICQRRACHQGTVADVARPDEVVEPCGKGLVGGHQVTSGVVGEVRLGPDEVGPLHRIAGPHLRPHRPVARGAAGRRDRGRSQHR